MAARQNLVQYKGATFNQPVRWLEGKPPAPVDMTDHRCTFVLMKPGVETPVFSKNAALVNSDGWMYFYVTDEETAQWDVQKYAYRIEAEAPGGEVRFLVVGTMDVRSSANV